MVGFNLPVTVAEWLSISVYTLIDDRLYPVVGTIWGALNQFELHWKQSTDDVWHCARPDGHGTTYVARPAESLEGITTAEFVAMRLYEYAVQPDSFNFAVNNQWMWLETNQQRAIVTVMHKPYRHIHV